MIEHLSERVGEAGARLTEPGHITWRGQSAHCDLRPNGRLEVVFEPASSAVTGRSFASLLRENPETGWTWGLVAGRPVRRLRLTPASWMDADGFAAHLEHLFCGSHPKGSARFRGHPFRVWELSEGLADLPTEVCALLFLARDARVRDASARHLWSDGASVEDVVIAGDDRGVLELLAVEEGALLHALRLRAEAISKLADGYKVIC